MMTSKKTKKIGALMLAVAAVVGMGFVVIDGLITSRINDNLQRLVASSGLAASYDSYRISWQDGGPRLGLVGVRLTPEAALIASVTDHGKAAVTGSTGGMAAILEKSTLSIAELSYQNCDFNQPIPSFCSVTFAGLQLHSESPAVTTVTTMLADRLGMPLVLSGHIDYRLDEAQGVYKSQSRWYLGAEDLVLTEETILSGVSRAQLEALAPSERKGPDQAPRQLQDLATTLPDMRFQKLQLRFTGDGVLANLVAELFALVPQGGFAQQDMTSGDERVALLQRYEGMLRGSPQYSAIGFAFSPEMAAFVRNPQSLQIDFATHQGLAPLFAGLQEGTNLWQLLDLKVQCNDQPLDLAGLKDMLASAAILSQQSTAKKSF